MTSRTKAGLAAAAVLVALGAGGAALASDGGGADDDDRGEASDQVTDRGEARRARDAALRATGGGAVTEIERADEGDEGYEVEVRRRDGSFAEVALDRAFRVVSVEQDDE
jgi:uncharacterized membrane protein YkoI